MSNSYDPHKYGDIIHLPHPVSSRHPRMPAANRAAQFAPFAALTGYDAAIRETARLTDRKIELDEYEREALDHQLQWALQHPGGPLPVLLTYFQPDSRKDGGAYVQTAGILKKIDTCQQAILLTDGRRIPLADVLSVEIAAAAEDEGISE